MKCLCQDPDLSLLLFFEEQPLKAVSEAVVEVREGCLKHHFSNVFLLGEIQVFW